MNSKNLFKRLKFQTSIVPIKNKSKLQTWNQQVIIRFFFSFYCNFLSFRTTFSVLHFLSLFQFYFLSNSFSLHFLLSFPPPLTLREFLCSEISLIDFNMSTQLGLFYALRSGNCIRWTFRCFMLRVFCCLGFLHTVITNIPI